MLISKLFCLLFPGYPKVPHVFLIYQDGMHLDFSTEEKMSPSKQFDIKLRPSITSYANEGFLAPEKYRVTGYLAYANLKNIYVFHTDGQKDITYINIESGKHRTISNTSYDAKFMWGSGLRVGNSFFMTGDKEHWSVLMVQNWKTKYYIWREKREKLQVKKWFPISKNTACCYTAYNR